MAALFVAGITPLLANMLPDLRAEGDFFTSGGGFAGVFLADLAGYLLPTQLHPVFGQLTQQVAGRLGFPVDKGQQIYLGYVTLALVVIGIATARTLWRSAARQEGRDFGSGRRRPGLFFLFTLGPNLRVAGHDVPQVPLPYLLLARLPFFEGNRYPSRYSVMLLLALAPLVALGTLSVLRRVEAWTAGPDIPKTPCRPLLRGELKRYRRLGSLRAAHSAWSVSSRGPVSRLRVCWASCSLSIFRCLCHCSTCEYRRYTRRWRRCRATLPCWNCRPAGATGLGCWASKTP